MFACRAQPLDKELEWTDEVRTLVKKWLGKVLNDSQLSEKLLVQDNCNYEEDKPRRI